MNGEHAEAPVGVTTGSWAVSEKAPFFLTVLLSVLIWAVTHIVDATRSSPTVEFTREIARRPDKKYDVSFVIRNISLANLLEKITFYVSTGDWVFEEPTITPLPPARIATGNEPPVIEDDGNARFYIPLIEPGWAFKLNLVTEGKPDPQLTFEFRRPSTASGDFRLVAVPLRLVQSNIETFLVRHQLWILVVLTAASCAALVFYLILLSRLKR